LTDGLYHRTAQTRHSKCIYMYFQSLDDSPTTHLQFTFNALFELVEMRESLHHESSGHSDGGNPEVLSLFDLSVLQLPPFDHIFIGCRSVGGLRGETSKPDWDEGEGPLNENKFVHKNLGADVPVLQFLSDRPRQACLQCRTLHNQVHLPLDRCSRARKLQVQECVRRQSA